MGKVWQLYLIFGCMALASAATEEVAETKERRGIVHFEKHFTDDEEGDDHGAGSYGDTGHAYGGGSHGGGSYGGGEYAYGGDHGAFHGGSYGDHGGHGKATSYQKFILHAGHPVKVLLKSGGGYGGYGDYGHHDTHGYHSHGYSGPVSQGLHGYGDHVSSDYDSGVRDYPLHAGGFDHSSFGTGDHADHD